MTEEKAVTTESECKAVSIVKILINLECPKDPRELPTWLKNIELLRKLLSGLWKSDVTGRVMIGCLNALYDVIAVNECVVSPAVWTVLDLVEKERINDIVEGILCDPSSNEDIKVQNALIAIVEGLCQYGPRAPKLQFWALSIIHGLQIRRNYSILSSVAEATIVSLSMSFLMHLYRPLVYPIYRLFLYSILNPNAFQKIIDKALRAILEMEKRKDRESVVCLADFTELLRVLLIRFPPKPGQEADYNAVKQAISRQPDMSVQSLTLSMWTPEDRSLYEWSMRPLMHNIDYARNGTYRGLMNQGNTCFLNSVLQALYMTTRFRKEILEKEIDPTERAAADLQQLFAFMQESSRTVLVPNGVMESTLPPTFRRGQQQDSSEYLIYLLDILHENESKVLRRVKGVAADSQDPGYEGQKEDCSEEETAFVVPKPNNDERNTIVERLFGGVLMSTTICSYCKKAFPRNDSFRDLHLSLPDDYRQSDLQELINASQEPEELCKENMYDCSSCGTKRDATRRQNLTKPPEHLILILKLFRFDPIRKLRLKLQSRLTIATTIEIPVYNSSQVIGKVTYELKAVIFHSGVSLDGGHYFATAMDETGDWYLFNDAVVSLSKCNWNSAYGTPYIIILRQSHITDPPKLLLSSYLQIIVNRDNQKYLMDKRFEEKEDDDSDDSRRDSDDDDDPPSNNDSFGGLGQGPPLVF